MTVKSSELLELSGVTVALGPDRRCSCEWQLIPESVFFCGMENFLFQSYKLKELLPLTLRHLVQQLQTSMVEPSKQFVSFLQSSIEHGLHPRTPFSVMTASHVTTAVAKIRI